MVISGNPPIQRCTTTRLRHIAPSAVDAAATIYTPAANPEISSDKEEVPGGKTASFTLCPDRRGMLPRCYTLIINSAATVSLMALRHKV